MAARSILRLLPPQIQVSAGAVLFEGRDLYALTDTNMRRLRGTAIGMVFQDPTMSLNPAMRVGAQLVEGLRQSTAMSQRECLFVAAEMLERVHVPNPVACMQQFPHQFSEGARQRIMLASAMPTCTKRSGNSLIKSFIFNDPIRSAQRATTWSFFLPASSSPAPKPERVSFLSV